MVRQEAQPRQASSYQGFLAAVHWAILAGIAVIAAAFAVGIWAALEGEGLMLGAVGSLIFFPLIADGFWAFLVIATLPAGIGLCILMKASALRVGGTPREAVILGRLAGAVVIVAGLAAGIKLATIADSNGFWAFLLVAMNPVGIGFLAIVSTGPLRGGRAWSSVAPIGPPAGVVIVAAALATGIKIATDVEEDAVWAFLFYATTPMGVGFLLFSSAAAVRGLALWRDATKLVWLFGLGLFVAALAGGLFHVRHQMPLLKYGWVFGFAVVVAALAVGIWAADDSPVNSVLTFLIVATTPVGIGLLVFVSAEASRRGAALHNGAIFARMCGGVVIVAALVLGVWAAVELGESEFWVFLLFGTTPLAFGLLGLTEMRRVFAER